MKQEQIPKLYRSALISIGACAIGISALLAVKYIFPNQDLSGLELIFITAFGGWFTNFIKMALKA